MIITGGADSEHPRITLKCDADLALELREQYPAVVPGYHVNKRLWNSIDLDGSIPDAELVGMVEHSYRQVIAGLPRPERERLLAQIDPPAMPP